MNERRWRQRFWAYLAAPGVFWWGLPVALTTTVWLQGRATGFRLSSYWSIEFAIRLAVGLIFGVIAGNVFGRTMKRHGADLAVLDGEDPERLPNDR
jgi:hypothetical protein